MNKEQLYKYIFEKIRYGKIRRRRTDVEMTCPFCGAENKFAINIYTGRHGCFRCELAFGSLSAIISSRSTEWASVCSGIVSQDRVPVTREDISLPLWTISGIPAPLTPSAARGEPSPRLVRQAYEYCTGRGMTREQITRYRVGVVAYTQRVYFPVWEEDRLSFYMGRSINDSNPKTIEPGTDKPLFGSHLKSSLPPGSVINLVEGVFDHFQTPNSFAVMGTNLSDRQINKLREFKPSWVNFMWDPDAHNKSVRTATKLWKSGVRCQIVRLRGCKDPGDLGRSTMTKIVNQLEQLGRPSSARVLGVHP